MSYYDSDCTFHFIHDRADYEHQTAYEQFFDEETQKMWMGHLHDILIEHYYGRGWYLFSCTGRDNICFKNTEYVTLQTLAPVRKGLCNIVHFLWRNYTHYEAIKDLLEHVKEVIQAIGKKDYAFEKAWGFLEACDLCYVYSLWRYVKMSCKVCVYSFTNYMRNGTQDVPSFRDMLHQNRAYLRELDSQKEEVNRSWEQ
jgi:hypothetical protein